MVACLKEANVVSLLNTYSMSQLFDKEILQIVQVIEIQFIL